MDNDQLEIATPETPKRFRLDKKTIKVAAVSALIGAAAVVVLSKRPATNVTVVDLGTTDPQTDTNA
jgi:hypothetical protein